MNELNQDKEIIKDICNQYNNDSSELINILQKIEKILGKISPEAQNMIAEYLSISPDKVNKVASISSFFKPETNQSVTISVCMGNACRAKGAQQIVDIIKEELIIYGNKTSSDGRYVLKTSHCVGACGVAPIVLIGTQAYYKVNVNEVKSLLTKLNHL